MKGLQRTTQNLALLTPILTQQLKLVFTLPTGQHKALETYVHYLNAMHFESYIEMKICSTFLANELSNIKPLIATILDNTVKNSLV